MTDLRPIRLQIETLRKRDHDGTMLPHAVASDCIKCATDKVLNRVREILDEVDTFDYRTLLVKYLRHVGQYEGSTFLGDGRRSAYPDMPEFTDGEWATLADLDQEAHNA